jgi:acyl-coenzyme A synthetase/AMP-(fatty) acid ligase
LKYLGRIDNQIKVLGFRVEPGEIEAVLRQEAGVPSAVAVGWPRTPSGAGGIVAFLEAVQIDIEALSRKVQAQLPSYMVPREYRVMAEFPRNANGKIDRRALMSILEGGK